MGGHSQWGALEPVLAVSGVVTSPSWGLQRPSSLSGGGVGGWVVYPEPMASCSSLVLLPARWGDQHPPPRSTKALENVRS